MCFSIPQTFQRDKISSHHLNFGNLRVLLFSPAKMLRDNYTRNGSQAVSTLGSVFRDIFKMIKSQDLRELQDFCFPLSNVTTTIKRPLSVLHF